MPESRPTSSVNDSIDSARPVAPERGPVQVPDQGADAIGRLLLRVADLLELRVELGEVLLVEQLARDVDLEREAEQDLREVVVEVAGDLKPFVGTLLGHRVRKLAKDLFTFLELYVGLLKIAVIRRNICRANRRGAMTTNTAQRPTRSRLSSASTAPMIARPA